ncbi:MAG: glycosyltransferase family 2 protein [Planctomycetes bacterium]|nr:glycosyltransferase family 2 protein [Planctomycetota bacterium]
MTKISILTPTLNRDPRVLERCFRSVAGQTLKDWEHLVCSDGQRELVVEQLVQRLYDPRRKYSYLSQLAGHYGAGVRAVLTDRAAGEYLAFLDDDNILFPRFAERMTEALDRHPEAGFAICQVVHCGPLPLETGLPPMIITGIPPVLYNIDTLQVVVRKQAIQQTRWQLRGYQSDGHTYEKLAREHRWIAVEEVLALKI